MNTHLTGGKFLGTIFFIFRENSGMEHRCVSGLSTVLTAEQPERQLGVVDHGGDEEFGPAQLVPVGPGPLYAGLPGQVSIWTVQRGRFRVGRRGDNFRRAENIVVVVVAVRG